jgi:hypothetical protein
MCNEEKMKAAKGKKGIRKTLVTQGFPTMENRGLEPLTSTLPEAIQLINWVK